MSDEPDKEIEPQEAAAPDADAASASADVPAADDAAQATRPDAEPAADAAADPTTAAEPVASSEDDEPAEDDADAEADDSDDAEEPEAAAEADDSEDADDESEDDEKPVATKPTPAAPARTRRRSAERDPDLPPPVVRAQARYVRSSARKARLVCDQFRGKSVEDARAILAVTPRAIARDWSKLLESAVANAEHNHELVGEDLVIKSVQADEGPTIKRFQPRAKGRATRIRKRTSHLTILLTPKD
jgi:ribosomal protein L22